MQKTTLSDLSLEDLLPHRSPMMLVEKVLEVDAEHAVTLCRVASSWPMADESGIHPLILIELAAQTAGVCNGWERVQTKGLESDKMGWLVGIKKAELFIDYLPIGGEIISSAENSFKFESLREVACLQHLDGKLIGIMTLQLFQA
jgi:predicted hotdog family 3-hydroxylacyl-ACP dehydratase